MSIFFITGTDTDCGKTYTTGQLITLIRTHNKTGIALKPVASGCNIENNQLINSDIVALEAANKSAIKINNWLFEPPVSPHLASSQLTAQSIAAFCQKSMYQQFDHILVEGAGGILVPLNKDETWVDVINMIPSIQVILVVGMKLGCLNHALLSEALMLEKGVQCAGWIANCIDPDMLMLEENIDTLKHKMSVPHLGTIGFGKQLKSEPILQDLFR